MPKTKDDNTNESKFFTLMKEILETQSQILAKLNILCEKSNIETGNTSADAWENM